MIKKRIILIFFTVGVSIAAAQDISIFFLKDGSIIQGKVVNENQHRIFLKTEQGTMKILPEDILGREDLARKGDLSFMSQRVDHLQNHVDHLTGQINHWNDSLSIAYNNLYSLYKNLEILQNEFEIDLLRLHSQGREQKKQIEYVQGDLVNQRIEIASNRQNMGGLDDSVTIINKEFNQAQRKLETTANQSFLLTGSVSNIKNELQENINAQQNQQNQIDIMAGSLANLIQEVQRVSDGFSSIEKNIDLNQKNIEEISINLSSLTTELKMGMDNMLLDINSQIKTTNNSIEDLDENSNRARKKIQNNLEDMNETLVQLKSNISKLNKEVDKLDEKINSLPKK